MVPPHNMERDGEKVQLDPLPVLQRCWGILALRLAMTLPLQGRPLSRERDQQDAVHWLAGSSACRPGHDLHQTFS